MLWVSLHFVKPKARQAQEYFGKPLDSQLEIVQHLH